MSYRFAERSLIARRLAAICIVLAVWSPASAWDDCTVGLYYDLYQAVAPIQQLTPCEPDLTVDDAYDFQERFIARLDEPLVGYKLGITASLAFGASEPVYGRLYGSMLRNDKTKIHLGDFVKPMLELEIAYVFAADVPHPITVSELPALVAAVAPAVELPDIFFKSMAGLDWKDIIAFNVGARQVIIGDQVSPAAVDVNGISITAKREGEVVAEGRSDNNLWGDQWAALVFLVDKLHTRGYHIKAGDVVISGAVNPLIPIEKGQYKVDYGKLGKLRFHVR